MNLLRRELVAEAERTLWRGVDWYRLIPPRDIQVLPRRWLLAFRNRPSIHLSNAPTGNMTGRWRTRVKRALRRPIGLRAAGSSEAFQMFLNTLGCMRGPGVRLP